MAHNHTTITPAALAAILDAPDAPVLIDLRDDEDAAADPRRIPGARAGTLAALEDGPPPEGPVVCTCQKGGKLSQIGAGLLRARGVAARYLTDGHLAWVAAGLPLMTARALPDRWIVAADAGWDELAAFWVLRRLVDRHASVLPVTRDWVTPALTVRDATAVPATGRDMAEMAGLDHPAVAHLSGGPARLLAGRLARVASPLEALDLVDDWLAGQTA
ncbi:rhodanese-like domain-containing protein [Jannaschia sp. KMU-145]|uniref:rhodanese-like domain-containing protein n=1 Tax=Jannaschia halovivens TaxID=3388667 RepID=UPI00396B4249